MLVVDDEASLRFILNSVLVGIGCDVACAATGHEAYEHLADGKFALALLDIVLPDTSGLEILARIKEQSPDTEVIMMTSHASIETAIDAIRKGAYDYLHKPFELDEVSATVHRAREKRQLMLDKRELMAIQEQKNQDLTVAVQRLSALNAAGIGISAQFTVSEILAFFLDIVVREMGASRVSILLTEPAGDQMRIASAYGLDATLVHAVRVRRGEGIAGKVMETGCLMLVTDAHDDARTASTARADLAPSFLSVPIQLSVPIKSMGRVLGVVNVTNRHTGQPFRPEDADFLSGLCGQVAAALERAHQTERLEDEVQLRTADVRAANVQLKSSMEQVEAASRVKSEFIARMSHELRTPLHGILSFSEFGRREWSSADREMLGEYFDHIRDSGQTLLILLNDLLDLAKLESGHMHYDMAPLDLATTVASAVAEWEAVCQERGLGLTLDGMEREITVCGDPLRFSQVLRNVLSNATRFARSHIRVWITVDGRCARVGIADDGVGLPQDELEVVFEKFVQSSMTKSGAGNTGLGLAISREIIVGHQGRIWADHGPEGGALITIEVPLAVSDQVPEELADPQKRAA